MRTPRLFLGIFVIALIVPLLMEIRPSRHPPARQGPGPGVVDPGPTSWRSWPRSNPHPLSLMES